MTREEINEIIDDSITNKTVDDSITPIIDGANRKEMLDYVDSKITKTSGSITLSGTFQVLPYDINSCSFSGGKAFLPNITENGKEILVIAAANNIEIRANESGTNRMFEIFNTFTSSVTLLTNEMYRFTYIGFGGYWKAEKI